MTRVMFGVAALVVAGLSGCASPARYVEKQGDAGVVAIPADTDVWPTYNRRAAMELIEKHVGPNYEIVEFREVATGQRTSNNQEIQNEQTWNRSNPLLPANKQTVQNTQTTQDVTEVRIAYRKRAGAPMGSPMGAQGLPGTVQQTQYRAGTGAGVQPAGGIVPSMAPGGGVVPAVGVQNGACPDGRCNLRN
jgi:hypothetical protein